ncbi:MAG TPA: bifunctional phosphoglucose/phosphomannose isomerase [Gemmatimonadota bacterium]|nr:bifunctional phosphoglucose/phosphomannose isomerase [Gemmatimonadota bacterium]
MTGGSRAAGFPPTVGPERVAAVDSRDMRSRIEGLPGDLVEAADRAARFADRLEGRRAGAVAVLGMGGSAIGGDLAAAATVERRRVPLEVVRGYDLPAWIEGDAWIVASSYSGNTEETLAAYEAAKARGLPAVAITTGGQLGERAGTHGDPVLLLPPGYPPRAALGHSFASCAIVVAALAPGLDVRAEADAIAAAGEAMRPLPEEWLATDAVNPAFAVAREASAALPLVYAGHPVAIAAARRWRTQLNENAKLLAFTCEFPEQNHNEIVGFEAEPVVSPAVFYLETEWDSPRVRRRMEIVRRQLDRRTTSQRRVEAGGGSPLEAMLRLCLLGDCASFLSSVITGRDPTPVASIDALKSELSGPR